MNLLQVQRNAMFALSGLLDRGGMETVNAFDEADLYNVCVDQLCHAELPAHAVSIDLYDPGRMSTLLDSCNFSISRDVSVLVITCS